jgi:hypothetical protein
MAGVPGVAAAMVADSELALLVGMAPGERLFTDVVDRIDLNGLPRFTLARRTGVSGSGSGGGTGTASP